MYPPITPTDLSILIDEADAAARRLHRKLVLPTGDLDDLRQDLLVDLICRLPGFDVRRGNIGAFANIVLRNQCSRIAIRHHRQRRAQGGALLSLEVPVSGSRLPVGDTLAETDGLAYWHGQAATAHSIADQNRAVNAAISRLPAMDRRFCAALADRSITALAAEGFGSRSALYRRLSDLRHVLTAHGLGPCWDDLATA